MPWQKWRKPKSVTSGLGRWMLKQSRVSSLVRVATSRASRRAAKSKRLICSCLVPIIPSSVFKLLLKKACIASLLDLGGEKIGCRFWRDARCSVLLDSEIPKVSHLAPEAQTSLVIVSDKAEISGNIPEQSHRPKRLSFTTKAEPFSKLDLPRILIMYYSA